MGSEGRTTHMFHPCRDGVADQECFLKLLTDAIRVAARGRRRAELREVQAALLARGWHP